jgi:hypothetical protein
MTDEPPQERPAKPEEQPAKWYANYANPIVVIAISILAAVFVLIGSAIMGVDKGVLSGMAKTDYARGLITYLFAIVTIGTAVVLVVSSLTAEETPAHKKRFQRGKEILSLLLGVFGTIVGFYFGSEVSGGLARKNTVQVAPIRANSQTGLAGSSITLDSYISGGSPPYRVGIGFDSDKVDSNERVDSTGWYSKSITLPSVPDERAVTIHLVAVDSDGNRSENSGAVIVRPK